MLRYPRCVWHRSRPVTTILVAALGALAVLAPVTITGEGVAAATPAEGYIATLIPVPPGSEESLVAVNSATNTVYLGNAVGSELNEITVVNGTTQTVTTSIPLAGPPQAIAVDPVTNTVYVSVDSSPPAVDVIDGATNAVTATIPLPSQSGPKGGMAVDSATDLVYVAEYYASEVVVINGATNTLSATVSTGFNTYPEGLAVDATSDVVWVANELGSVIAISGTSDTVTQTVSISGDTVSDVDVDPATDTVYAAVQGDRPFIAVIDGLTGAVSTTISLTETFDSVAVDPVTDTVFASSINASSPVYAPGTTWVIDGSSNTITDTIVRGGNQIAVSTSSGSAYVAPSSAQINAAWALAPSTANAMSPVIASTYTTLMAGTTVSSPIDGTALPAATYSESGRLPSGITLSPSGILSGTLAAGTGGAYPITLTASNGVAPDYSEQFNLLIDEAPVITSADQATFDAGVPGSFLVTATGYPAYSFFETGALPSGVTLSVSGFLSGTPAAGSAGVYPITLTASNGVAPDASQSFTLIVTAPAVGVEGTDGALWVRAPQLGSGWQSLGGVITAPPAVAAAPDPNGATLAQPLFVGTGTDKTLWIRSLTDGWQQIGAARCLGAAGAVITGTAASGYTMTVACRGTDNALWYNTATVPTSGLPAFTGSWTSLGGVLSAGPAIAPVGSTVTFFVRGTSGAIYTRTASAGYAVTPWSCTGQPAAEQAATGTTTFACNAGGALWESADSGSGWTTAVSLGGSLIGGPAVTATSQEADFLAEGTDHAIWQRTPAGWVSIGGSAVSGVGAVALI